MALQRSQRVVIAFLAGILIFSLIFLGIAHYMYRHIKPQGSVPVDVFPGATPEPGPGRRYLTPAPAVAVIDYYHRRFPDAIIQEQGASLVLVEGIGRDRVTITAHRLGDRTEFQIGNR